MSKGPLPSHLDLPPPAGVRAEPAARAHGDLLQRRLQRAHTLHRVRAAARRRRGAVIHSRREKEKHL